MKDLLSEAKHIMLNSEAKDQIVFIKQIIDDSMGILRESGGYYVLWGAAVIIGTVATYLAMAKGLSSLLIWIWIGVYLCGTIGVIVLNRKRGLKKPKTLARRVYRAIWFSIGIFGVLFAACSILTQKIPLEAGMSFIAGLLGIAYYINSRLNRNAMMSALAFGWWAGSVIIFFIPPPLSPLALSVLILFLELIPGIVLCVNNKALRTEKT